MINYYAIEKLNYYREEELRRAEREHWKFAAPNEGSRLSAMIRVMLHLMKLNV